MPVTLNYVSVAELKNFKVSGELVDLVAFTDDELTEAIHEAEEFIEWITGDWFYAKSMTLFVDGNGEYEQFLQPTMSSKIISITSVDFVDGDGATVLDTYVENTDFKVYDYFLRMIHLAWDIGDIRRVTNSRGKWPRGERNLKIVGSFGNTPTPGAIIRATKLLALERLIPGIAKLSTIDADTVIWPDFSIKFKSEAKETYTSTGYAEIDRMLQPYVNMSGLFNVVPDHRTSHTNLAGD